MAISPEDAKTLSYEEKRRVKLLESRIDQILGAEFRKDTVTICLSGLPVITISDRVFEALKKIYEEAGWQVTKNFKKSEPWIKFKPVKEDRS